MRKALVLWFILLASTATAQTKIRLQPNNSPNLIFTVSGYYAHTAVLFSQWGPAFVNTDTGAMWGPDYIINCENPGVGRLYCNGLDVHGCCPYYVYKAGQLFVQLNVPTKPPAKNRVAVYSVEPPAFMGFIATQPIGLPPATADANGYTWRVVSEGDFATGWKYLYRSDTPGPTPPPVTPQPQPTVPAATPTRPGPPKPTPTQGPCIPGMPCYPSPTPQTTRNPSPKPPTSTPTLRPTVPTAAPTVKRTPITPIVPIFASPTPTAVSIPISSPSPPSSGGGGLILGGIVAAATAALAWGKKIVAKIKAWLSKVVG